MTTDDDIKKLLAEDAEANDESLQRVMAFFEEGTIEDETPIFEPEETSIIPVVSHQGTADNELDDLFKIHKSRVTAFDLDFLVKEEALNLRRLDDNVRTVLIEADGENLSLIEQQEVIFEGSVKIPTFIRPNRDDKVFNRIVQKTYRLHIAGGRGRKVRSDVLLATWNLNERYYRRVIKRLELISKLRELLTNERQ